MTGLTKAQAKQLIEKLSSLGNPRFHRSNRGEDYTLEWGDAFNGITAKLDSGKYFWKIVTRKRGAVDYHTDVNTLDCKEFPFFARFKMNGFLNGLVEEALLRQKNEKLEYNAKNNKGAFDHIIGFE